MRSISFSLYLVLVAAACTGAPSGKSARYATPSGLKALPGAPDAERFLGEESEKAQKAGAEPSLVLAVEAGAPGDRISGMVAVPEASCVALLARASSSIEDIDLFAYGNDGTLLGADEAEDRVPALIICPPHPRHIFVAARVASGHGLVAVAAHRVEPRHATAVGRAIGAKADPERQSERLARWSGIEERLAEHRARIGSDWQDVQRLALPVEARLPTHLSAVVEARRCLDILVLPSQEVSHLDVAALDMRGRIVGRAAAVGSDRTLIVCSELTAPITVELRPHVGRGLAVVLLSRSAEGGASELDAPVLRFDLTPPSDLEAQRARLAAAVENAGYAAPRVVARGHAEVGRRASTEFDAPGGCSRLDVFAGDPARGVDAWLWTDDGVLLAHDRKTTQATLYYCGPGGRTRLDVEAELRAGRYLAELRHQPETAATLTQHSLAASRLLSRMHARGVIRSVSQAGAPKVVSVGPAELARVEILVPLGRCVDATLALGPGASGAELRLVERTDHREYSLARGTHSASSRACTLDGSKTLALVAELRATAGSAEALFATRMLAPKP